MKFFAVVVFLVFALQLAYSQTSWKRNKRIVSYDCEPPCKTKVSAVTIGPCSDTQGCKMPDCCGIISGALTNISFTYTASIPMETATSHAYIVGIQTGTSKKKVEIPLADTQSPNIAEAYDYNSCDYTTCPQEVGNVYRFDGLFTFPTTLATTGNVNIDVRCEVTSNAPDNPAVFCRKVFVRVVNPNAVQSARVDKNPVLGVTAGKAFRNAFPVYTYT